jgi:branched-chain amino acid transport system permease protein
VLAVAAALALGLPFVLTTPYLLRVLNIAVINALLAVSLNIVLGLAGQLSLGQAGFWGIGAYTSAILTVTYGWPFAGGLLAGILLATLFGIAIGAPALRLRGVYLALATLGFGEIVRLVLLNWKEVTHGQDGIGGLPPAGIGPLVVTTDRQFYYLLLVVLVLVVVASNRLRRTKYGRAFLAVRQGELAAEVMGVPTTRIKILAFAVSAGLAGAAGVLYAHLYAFVSPDVFGLDVSVALVAMLLVGGVGSAWGAVAGAAILTALPEVFRFSREYYMVIYGVGIVLLIVFLPSGLAGLLPRRPDPSERRSLGASARSLPGAPALDRAGRDGLLEIQTVTMRFGGLVALDRVSLDVARGTIHAIMGPNGSGKSTLLNVITGIYPPESGSVTFAGHAITRASPHVVTALGLARTFQNLRLFAELSALENVMIGGHCRTRVALPCDILGLPAARREEQALEGMALEALRIVGLEGRAADTAGALPYAQQRLLEIARALATHPALLLLDEPSAGMTTREAQALVEGLLAVRGRGVTIVLVEHNIPLVMRTADQITVLDFGRVIAEGPPADVRRDPAVIAAYLGTPTDTPHDAGSAAMYHCENYGNDQDRYESRDQSNWHHSHHFFFRSEYGRVLKGFIHKSWHQPNH